MERLEHLLLTEDDDSVLSNSSSQLYHHEVDTSHLESTSTHGGKRLIQTVTIDGTMPFCVLISSDAEVSLMSM
jgi:hypothetical protein